MGGGGSYGYHGELRGESVVANMQSVKGETVENECWRGGITGILESPGKGGRPPLLPRCQINTGPLYTKTMLMLEYHVYLSG